jgi:hypothetical protein
MPLHASWTHGNAVRVESPENFKSIKPMGWGTDLEFIPDRQSWLHIPVPTPVIVKDVRVKVQTFFLLFTSDSAFLNEVHIFDGPARIQTFLTHGKWGKHGNGIDADNTFKLSTPHSVAWGMSISCLFKGSDSIEVIVRPKLSVIAAGADFTT